MKATTSPTCRISPCQLGFYATILLLVLLQDHFAAGSDSGDVVSAGCQADDSQQLERVYVVSGGQLRYHIRAPSRCVSRCDLDPYTPVPCPAGYYEKDYAYGCQNCSEGCPLCSSGNWADCVLQELFPNACRYSISGSFGTRLDLLDDSGLANRRNFKIRQCENDECEVSMVCALHIGCHDSCMECSGPSNSQCTLCPNTGDYWPVGKRCNKISWSFSHGKQYQCFSASHCYLEHPALQFVDLPECRSHQVNLFEDQKFCLKCNDRYCHANCSHASVTPECAFRDYGDGYHCRSKEFHYLGVFARACVDMSNACASNPCPESYQCRNTLDWEGYACDCNKTDNGRQCPPLKYPHPVQPNLPRSADDIGSGDENNATETEEGSAPTSPDLQTSSVPEKKPVSKANDHDAKIIGFSVACGLLLVLIVTVAVLIVRKKYNVQQRQKATPAIARFLRRNTAESDGKDASQLPNYRGMQEEPTAVIS